MKIVFLGAGFVNFGGFGIPWDHASRLEKISGIDIVGIVDPLTDKASKTLETRKLSAFGNAYKHCQVFPNLDSLLSSGTKVDAAIVGTPPYVRGAAENGKDIELKLVEAGIHVFCEKPVTSLLPEEFAEYSKNVSVAAREKKVIFSVGYMFRYHNAINKMKELIAKHGGKVMSLEARYYYAYQGNSDPNWWTVSKSGGPVVEQATHFCDVARYLAGDVDHSTITTLCLRVEDQGGAGEIESPVFEKELSAADRAPRVTMSHWRFQAGGLGSLVHTIALKGTKYETSLEVQMNGLRMTLLEPYESECTLRVRDETNDIGTVYNFGDGDPYDAELKMFLEAIEKNDQSLVRSSYEDATKTYNFTWAIRRAEIR